MLVRPRGLNAELREALSGFVAETVALQAKTRAAHWNATGPGFIGLHKLTDEQVSELGGAIDRLAERLRALGVAAPSGLVALAAAATLADLPEAPSARLAASILMDDHASLAEHARDLATQANEAEDLATHDMLVARIAAHQKAAWLLHSAATPETEEQEINS
jgi:starvation-inducible DNA-binding protein